MSMFKTAPVYLQLFEKLKSKIENGRLGPPGTIISGRHIARRYSLSRDTVNRSLDKLIAEHYIKPKAGRGFIIRDHRKVQQDNQIGVVLHSSDIGRSGFYFDVVSGIEERCRQEGVLINWLSSTTNGTIDTTYLTELYEDKRIKGFIFLAVENRDMLNAFADKGIPIVSADYNDPGLRCDAVVLGHLQACRLAVQALVRAGWERFAIVVLDKPDDYPSIDRQKNYLIALKEAGFQLPESRIYRIGTISCVKDPIPLEEKKRIIWGRYRDIVKDAGVPTAFLTAYDYDASGIFKISKRMGYRVPQDIALVTFGDPAQTEQFSPPIPCLYTTDSRSIGIGAVECLFERIEGKAQTDIRKIAVPMKLAHETSLQRTSVGFEPEFLSGFR